jgi:hypothetical protein
MIATGGIAPRPSLTPTSLLGAPITRQFRALALRDGPCQSVHALSRFNNVLYIGCAGGYVTKIGPGRRVLGGTHVVMDGINGILAAGDDAIAISGWADGAALRAELTILRASTLRPILPETADSTFLGALGDRAYIDDWCCNGRPDVYRPATIYSVSLRDGAQGAHVDLSPEPALHTGIQPLGQGAHNYMVGDYFYVVVGPVTYRYDVRDLNKAPFRMASKEDP